MENVEPLLPARVQNNSLKNLKWKTPALVEQTTWIPSLQLHLEVMLTMNSKKKLLCNTLSH